MTRPRLRLVLAVALFVGWLGWLGYAAVNKGRGPVVSRSAAAVATHPVVAAVQAGAGDLEGKAGDRAAVVESLRPGGPAVGAELEVLNLPAAAGYVGAGKYLLLLTKDPIGNGYSVVRRPRSPGGEADPSAPPVIYPWADDGVKAQARVLFR